jgi:predicted phage-related endonuclease
MFDHCIRFEIPTHSPEWYQFRTVGNDEYPGGIGGSETGKVLGLDNYRPVLAEVYHHKVGTETPTKFDNLAMCMGRILEPTVMHFWQCFNGDTEEMVHTYEAWMKTKQDSVLVRKASEVNCYLVNPEYPWLFTSLDFAINKGEPNLITGEPLETECPLEIKTISKNAARVWEEGIPPKYVCQVNQQMIVTNTYYAEIAVLVDNGDFKIYRFERDEELCERIIQETRDFWFKKVLPGRRAKKYRDAALVKNKTNIFEKYEGEIQMLEPEPDTTAAWKDYLSEQLKVDKELMTGSQFDLKMARLYKTVDGLIKELNKKKQLAANFLVKSFVKNNVEEIDLLKAGKITYRESGKSRRLNVSIKKPDPKLIEAEIDKVNKNLYDE